MYCAEQVLKCSNWRGCLRARTLRNMQRWPASSMPEQHLSCIEPRFRGSLTLADAVVVTSIQGLTQAADFVSIVDPWCYPGELTTAPLNVKR